MNQVLSKETNWYARLISLYDTKQESSSNDLLSIKILEYLNNNKEILLSGAIPPSFPKFAKSK